jgi:hypothetical protein
MEKMILYSDSEEALENETEFDEDTIVVGDNSNLSGSRSKIWLRL